MNTLDSLLKITQQICSIPESNGHFVEGLVRRIDETGRDIGDLKISELITLIEQHREFFNNSLTGNIANDSVATDSPEQISLDEMLSRQDRERGFDLIPLESDLLIKRAKDGGYSGQFLADAFISHYRTDHPFNHSLGKVIKLDAEAFRLFHQIIHIRFISGWSDDSLYQVEKSIKEVM